MLDNPMNTSAGAELDRQERREKLAAQAYGLLQAEFMRAVTADPRTPISTPGTPKHERPLADVVAELLTEELDHHTLDQMLRVTVQRAPASHLAEGILVSLAHRYAELHTDLMTEQGAFDE